jgi:polyhydroxybutyrate depolymerase
LKRGLPALLLLLAACSAQVVRPLPPARSVHTVKIGGVDRSYILRLPKAYDGEKKVPLVMLLHGATDSAAYAEQAYHFSEKGEAEGFVLLLPDALGESHAWNGLAPADDPHQDTGDLAFLLTLLKDIPATYAIDPDRVYVCGHSSGAIMTYRVIAERPDLIAAAGIVAGSVGGGSWVIPTPKSPMPLILFHGRQDTNIPYGEPVTGTVAEAIAFWTRANDCPQQPSSTDRPVPTVERETFISRLASHPDIVLYSLDNGNHMWPGGREMPGKTEQPVQDISATDLMWAFFKAHPRAAPPASPAPTLKP